MNLSFESLSFLIVLSCYYYSTGSVIAMEVSEAQQIALESSGELLPPEHLVQRIEKDLQAIRSKSPEVANVHHTNKWQPGKLIISNVKKETLEAIQKSSYGPAEAQPIFQDTIYTVQFTKPYNPERLAEVLQKELGVTDAHPDGVIGGSSGITLTGNASGTGTNTYVFFMGSGDCPAGCINKRFLTFTVDPEENVQLVKDSGESPTDQPAGTGMGIGLH